MLSRRSDGRQSDRQTASGGLNKNKTGRQTDRQTRQTNQTDTQKPAAMLSRRSDHSQTDIQTGSGWSEPKRQTDRQTHRQTDRQRPDTQTKRTDRQASSDAEQVQ